MPIIQENVKFTFCTLYNETAMQHNNVMIKAETQCKIAKD